MTKDSLALEMELRSMVLCSLLLVALLYRFTWLASFLAASSPVLLLTAFLLGVVLVHSDPPDDVPLAPEDRNHRHLYKKICHLTGGSSSTEDVSDSDHESSASGDVSSMEDMEEDHLVDKEEEEEEVVKTAVAWTTEDEHNIQSIGTLELERDARLEKLMSRRSLHRHHFQRDKERNLIDLDVHIPAVLAPRKNPFDLLHGDFPGSAPSSLIRNPFDSCSDVQGGHPDQEESERNAEAMLRRHESFTAGAAPFVRPSCRFRPYFVADDKPILEGGGGEACSDNSNSSSSSSSSSSAGTGSDHHQKQQVTPKAAEGESAASPGKWNNGNGNGNVMAVDVELISDSSDDDISLPGDDEDDSFEVESITQQVAAGKQQQQQMSEEMVVNPVYGSCPSPSGQQTLAVQKKEEEKASSSSGKEGGGAAWVAPSTLASVEENEKREREVSEIREHHIFPLVVVDSSSSSVGAGAAGAGGAVVAPPPPAATASASGGGKTSSSKYKVPKKVPVFGFFRK